MCDESKIYDGGDIAGAVFGTLICGTLLAILIWWMYKNYWKNRKGTHLVVEDPENAKNDFAFDNPAFKNDKDKSNSMLDSKWMPGNGNDKRKAMDDSYAGSPNPRLVSLRGSDFTGLGVEVCGGLKDGIFVKKVMPQGPAAGVISIGDRITSITIDFRHIVQEDAMTILSYASPYNVQLEVIDGQGTLSNMATPSPKVGQHQSLTHPLYRSSSQEDLNTIERNARKKIGQSDDTNYPTLKMEQQRQSPTKVMPAIHSENEKKQSFKHQIKGLIEEKLQTKSNHHQEPLQQVKADIERRSVSPDDGKKGLKFGIRVLPPNVNEKMFGKSPTKVQADNENNTNIEKVEEPIKNQSPPPISKRSKNKKEDKPEMTKEIEFIRQGSLNSSGIKRDADGIPQEMPSHMMHAAMAAKENRKSAGAILDSKKSKGKAPKPPPEDDIDFDVSTITTNTDISIDMPDHGMSPMGKLNFTDNFADEILGKMNGEMNKIEKDRTISDGSTPKSDRKKYTSDTESQMASQHDHESDLEMSSEGAQIELNSSQITVHQSSEGESSDEGRRTASLGDLSKFEGTNNETSNRSNQGTLERAQSLEMSESISEVAKKMTPKKRKAQSNTENDLTEIKEPRLMEEEMSGLDTLQRGRLKRAYEWGNLSDAIYDGHNESAPSAKDSDTESFEQHEQENNNSMDMIKQVMAVADRYEAKQNEEAVKHIDDAVKPYDTDRPICNEFYEVASKHSIDEEQRPNIVNTVEVVQKEVEMMPKDIETAAQIQQSKELRLKGMDIVEQMEKQMQSMKEEFFDIIEKTKEPESLGSIIFINKPDESIHQNGVYEINGKHETEMANGKPESDLKVYTSSTTFKTTKSIPDVPQEYVNEKPEPLDRMSQKLHENGLDYNYSREHITISPVQLKFDEPEADHQLKMITQFNISNGTSGDPMDSQQQIKIVNNETNVPDDVKVSRYPFGSLERPKSDVLKKILSTKHTINDDDHEMMPNNSFTTTTTTTTTTTILGDGGKITFDGSSLDSHQPISLTLIGGTESDLTESSQISPVYSSDGQGVNSISISSIDIQKTDALRKDAPYSTNTGLENVVTISTDSQPSSIIMIDDEKLDFTLQLPEDIESSLSAAQKLDNLHNKKAEVFVVESLSSKKLPEITDEIEKTPDEESKSFVTEIRVQTPTDQRNAEPTKMTKQLPAISPKPVMQKPIVVATNTHNNNNGHATTSTTMNFIANERRQLDDANLPRNAEIKFTTSTYESPRHIAQSKLSHIDQIRSNFEKSNNVSHSEHTPVQRKSSIPMLKTSPSKIPVFNSVVKNGGDSPKSNGSSSPPSLNNKVTVSVTSIKNSSRNPSGK